MNLSLLLDMQRQYLSQLLALLQEEQECLVQGQVDALHLVQLTDAKSSLQQALAKAESRRHQTQCQLNYSDDDHGALQIARDNGCEPIWLSIRQIAQEISRANRRNGELLQLRMDHNQHMLDHLHRIAAANVYHANGRAPLQSPRLDVSA
ncbi:flagella synthesis protein FlgN [Halomonas binhaiensis]|uniref:Flagellar protein FlgN n=1 Tax=Halomonas binhaiensis TaxID=2562282 RepID=A0A5C1NMX5_9GAMM|nr:flagellar protein FlgN [Halomonas binhaiensis]QEM83807.1 flagellar protein FlgN [Halomonas binhaiensis]